MTPSFVASSISPTHLSPSQHTSLSLSLLSLSFSGGWSSRHQEVGSGGGRSRSWVVVEVDDFMDLGFWGGVRVWGFWRFGFQWFLKEEDPSKGKQQPRAQLPHKQLARWRHPRWWGLMRACCPHDGQHEGVRWVCAATTLARSHAAVAPPPSMHISGQWWEDLRPRGDPCLHQELVMLLCTTVLQYALALSVFPIKDV
jgi:hypothetical protein